MTQARPSLWAFSLQKGRAGCVSLTGVDLPLTVINDWFFFSVCKILGGAG